MCNGITEAFLKGIAQNLLADLRAELLNHNLERHLAGPESSQFDGTRQPLQARFNLAVDISHRHGNVQLALERTQRFQIRLHRKFPIEFIRSALVRKEGLEPTRLSAPEPKSGASTNSATFALQQRRPGLLTPASAVIGIFCNPLIVI